jgi:hypothetical protein
VGGELPAVALVRGTLSRGTHLSEIPSSNVLLNRNEQTKAPTRLAENAAFYAGMDGKELRGKVGITWLAALRVSEKRLEKSLGDCESEDIFRRTF